MLFGAVRCGDVRCRVSAALCAAPLIPRRIYLFNELTVAAPRMYPIAHSPSPRRSVSSPRVPIPLLFCCSRAFAAPSPLILSSLFFSSPSTRIGAQQSTGRSPLRPAAPPCRLVSVPIITSNQNIGRLPFHSDARDFCSKVSVEISLLSC